MRILDTHLHLVYKDKLSYPWLSGAPAIDRQWTADDYFAEAVPLGIEGALHMEVDVAESDMEAETRLMRDVHPRVVGMIAPGRPESPDFPAWLDLLAGIGQVRAIRRVLHVAPDEVSQGALFRENIRRMAGAGLPFDICVGARQLPIALELVKACPETQFVLDHCGVPDVGNKALDPWRADITALAALPNVVAKISGIAAYAAPDWTPTDLRPFVEHVIGRFGWDRVVWGSDHPVVTLGGSLSRWVAASREIVAGASDDEQAKLFHRNAERIYRV